MAQSIDRELKDKILRKPDVILDDQDVMRALLDANDQARGRNIVDIRGAAMQRLEARLGQLENTHQSVIAVAHDNLAGTKQIQRAVLRLLDHFEFETFLNDLNEEICAILRIDCIFLVLETSLSPPDKSMATLTEFDCVRLAPENSVRDFLSHGQRGRIRDILLRRTADCLTGASAETTQLIFGSHMDEMKSLAAMRLDLGEGRRSAMLVLGAKDPKKFQAQQGTDLLAFFASAVERILHRWLR